MVSCAWKCNEEFNKTLVHREKHMTYFHLISLHHPPPILLSPTTTSFYSCYHRPIIDCFPCPYSLFPEHSILRQAVFYLQLCTLCRHSIQITRAYISYSIYCLQCHRATKRCLKCQKHNKWNTNECTRINMSKYQLL